MKSLEERVADRAKRKEEAQAAAEANGTAVPNDDAEKDYSSWKVADLKAELDSREVEYEAGAKKADLVAALEANDAE